MVKNPLIQIWQQVLSLLEKEMSRPSFDTWLKSTELLALDNDMAVIGVPNEFAKGWLQDRYYKKIQEKLEMVLEKQYIIRFIIPNEELLEENFEEVGHVKQKTNPTEKIKKNKSVFIGDDYTPQLNSKYVFDSFVIGNGNRFAHAACLAVAESIAKAYNPLFIYGGVGLGKTHLMHAIGHYVLDNYDGYKVVYVSSEKFTNELINSIRDDSTVEFRNKYRSIDVLLIDDIQFLANKERTQEEFFHTFNALHEANKQIIISSDRPPKDIPTLEDRLRSRFEWGLITDIQAPDLETRIAILQKKADIENLNIPNEVLLFIANKIHSNIRELEGALIRVVAYSSLTFREISLELAQEALKDILPESKAKLINAKFIQEKVAEHFNLKIEDLKAKKRTRNVSFPRQIAMYICRELTDLSLPKIGEEFGGRDHTTVIHAHEKIALEMKQKNEIFNTVNSIINSIKK